MLSFVVSLSLLHIALCVVPEPSQYILSFPTEDNPLNITVVSPVEKNYFMLLGIKRINVIYILYLTTIYNRYIMHIIHSGDWGAEALENKDVQAVVAQKMNAYYNKQFSNGYNLLSVLSLGDNFYYTGQTCNEYGDHWSSVYGANLTSNRINWIATMGNHDWGDSDQWAMCGMYLDIIMFVICLYVYFI